MGRRCKFELLEEHFTTSHFVRCDLTEVLTCYEVIYSHVFYNNDWFKDAICKETSAPASSIVLICALTLSQKVPNNTNPKISIIQLKLTAFNLVACRFNFPGNNVTKRNVTKKNLKAFFPSPESRRMDFYINNGVCLTVKTTTPMMPRCSTTSSNYSFCFHPLA